MHWLSASSHIVTVLDVLIFNGTDLQLSIFEFTMNPEKIGTKPKTSSVLLGTLLHFPVPWSHLSTPPLFEAGIVTRCTFVQQDSGTLISAEPSRHHEIQSITVINFVPCFLFYPTAAVFPLITEYTSQLLVFCLTNKDIYCSPLLITTQTKFFKTNTAIGSPCSNSGPKFISFR